ncbi:uncharacterized protein LOC131933346 [Physella acuta]|uniref:uncharacterized protein LOC131933346 n=1 Tax=Physella acuta TaxID=109671 RepID=UPI0027DCAABD|nr:uncharacterized protein LOC131933346 [Physella acuta]
MDGVSYVTQCPITPMQQFTYKFEAYPRGTFWYHSHLGTQIAMGLYGPLIVKERDPQAMEEFVMMLQDWNHDMDADLIHFKVWFGNFINRTKVPPSHSLDGAFYSTFPYHAGLINGKGRFHYGNGSHNGAPLSIFTVTNGTDYRFRVIGASGMYPFRISIDNHPLLLVASDGYDCQPRVIESVVVHPGERYDFIITANQTVGNYWIRGVTMESGVDHISEAILRYTGAPIEEPNSTRRNCTEDDRCLVMNCPFTYYPKNDNITCLHLDDLASTNRTSAQPGSESKADSVEEVFLNFAFPGDAYTPGSVNGREFVVPPVSSLTQPQDITSHCQPNQCGEDRRCACTYTIDLVYNKTYQLILLNMGKGKGFSHPIHLHGHSFQVVKLGYPPYNETTGQIMGDNLDINCGGNPNRSLSYCNQAKWANSSWGGNNVPGLNLLTPPRKDTILVPTGGYVVLRLKADNPGVWFMHCHIEVHGLDGMAIMFNESFSSHPKPPPSFPKCGSFQYDKEAGSDAYTGNQTVSSTDDDEYDKRLFWIVVGCLIGLVVIQFVIIVVLCCRGKVGGGSGEKYELSNNSRL